MTETKTAKVEEAPQTEVATPAPVGSGDKVVPMSRPEHFAGNVEVELSAPFWTNGVAFGPEKEYGDDEDPTFVTVKVTPEIAVDLRRRQSEYDRARRNRFISRRGGQFTPDQTPTA